MSSPNAIRNKPRLIGVSPLPMRESSDIAFTRQLKIDRVVVPTKPEKMQIAIFLTIGKSIRLGVGFWSALAWDNNVLFENFANADKPIVVTGKPIDAFVQYLPPKLNVYELVRLLGMSTIEIFKL